MIRVLRRPVLQLAALLDLMLIVMFAQFLELKTQIATDQEAAQKQRAAGGSHERELAAERDALRSEIAARNAEAADLRQRLDSVAADNERLRRREGDLQEGLNLSLEQRDIIGRLTAELFRLPPEMVEKLLKPSALAAEKRLSNEQVKELTRKFQALAENRAGDTTRHLLTYSELLKRADIWDVYLTQEGNAKIEGGGRKMVAPAPVRGTTPEDFAQRLIAHYKSIPQPKSVVIILMSYENVPYADRDVAFRGIRLAAEKMQDDSGGRTHFEYANLGYHPREMP